MFKRFIPIAAVVLALAGSSAVSASVEQGKSKGKSGAAHAQRVQKDKQKNKSKRASTRPNATDTRWTDEQRARYRSVLPAGMTLEQAAAGFPNHGQAVAALNAAREHNVSFVQLKHLMLNENLSLGEALRRLRR
jgi:hypothetical protein